MVVDSPPLRPLSFFDFFFFFFLQRHYEIAKMAKLLNSKRFRYALHEYVVSLLVTAGAAGFLLSGVLKTIRFSHAYTCIVR